jgi:hypothetical protein
MAARSSITKVPAVVILNHRVHTLCVVRLTTGPWECGMRAFRSETRSSATVSASRGSPGPWFT